MSSDTFIREATTSLRQLTDELVELEETGDSEAVNEIFRVAHSLKSTFSMEGYEQASELAHAIEDVVEAIRAGRVGPNQQLIDESLSAADTLKTMLDEIERQGQIRTDPTSHIESLHSVIESVQPTASSPPPESPSEVHSVRDESDVSVDDEEVQSALDAASEFDDLDALVEDMDEPEGVPTLEGAGTFDEVLQQDEDGPNTAETGEEAVPEADSTGGVDEFTSIRAEVEEQGETSLSELQSEIEAESFGQFDDEDDMTIQELVSMGETDDTDRDSLDGSDGPATGTDEPSSSAETDPGEQDALKQVFDALSSDATTDDNSSRAQTETAADGLTRPDSLDPPSEQTGNSTVGIETFGSDSGVEQLESRFESFGGSQEEPTAITEVAATIEESALSDGEFRTERTERAGASVTDAVQSLTVDVEYADELLSLVEDLSIETRRLTEATESAADRETLDSVTSTVRELQRTVMEIRLVPVETVTSNLHRVARDSARSTDTQVSLSVTGAGTRVDRSIVDRLGDPLIHLVRNAVDHGIEPPAEREAVGKDPTGTIDVSIARTGEHITVEVSDDGQGIDPESVRTEAIDAGLLSRSEAASVSGGSLYELIFHPGISTAESVTSTSGRGVGMDVVRESVSAMNGQLSVDSTPGEGTTIRLRLPVTMAVSELVILAVGEQEFAVPASEVAHIGPDSGGRVTRSLRTAGTDRRIDLGEALEIAPVTAEQPTVVAVDTGDGQLGIECEQIIERRTGIVTPYDGPLSGIPEFSGAATGTGGQLIHVIDVSNL